jgi:hypothetical protein
MATHFKGLTKLPGDSTQYEAGSTVAQNVSVGNSTASHAVRFSNGQTLVLGKDAPTFTLLMRDENQYAWLLRADVYSTATAFVRGEFDVEGDIVAAIRFKKSSADRHWRDVLATLAARFAPQRAETWFQSARQAAWNVRFHYDRSNEF